MAKKRQEGASDETRMVITILLLIFAFPVGFILMWIWTRWDERLKLAITIPTIIIFFIVIFNLISSFSPNPDNLDSTYTNRACNVCLKIAKGDKSLCTLECHTATPTPEIME